MSMLPEYPEATRRALARNLLRNSLHLRRGEDLLIDTWSATLPWATSLELEARILGAHPLVATYDEEAYWRSAREAPRDQMGRIGEHEWAALKASDAYLYLYGPMDTLREERQPPVLARRLVSANHELMRILQKYGIRSIRWDLGRTSPVWAQRYGVDLNRWRRELIDAAMVDPRSMRREGRAIADRLRRGRTATISHANGTHLELRLAGRPPKIDDGGIDEQAVRAGNVYAVVPSGVTGVTVSETEADGVFVSNAIGVIISMGEAPDLPLGLGHWKFEDGVLADFEATGADNPAVRRALENSGGGPLRPGLLSVGLNPKISSIPLLFDQERGTIAFLIGRNAMLGGKSRTPRISAYLTLRGGTLDIDGETVVDRGEIVA
jgi:leucyl aminopeptidase (aminopeptidase T)